MVLPSETPAWLRHTLQDLATAQVRSDERLAVARAETEAQFSRLAAAQSQTEARFSELATAGARVDERLEQLATALEQTEAQVGRLATAQEQTEARVEQLATALEQTEAQVGRLATAQEQTEARVEQLATALEQTEAQVGRLATAQEQTEAQVGQLVTAQERIETRLGAVTGWVFEARVQAGAPSFLGRLVRRVHVLRPPELDNLLDPAVQDGRLSEDDADEVRRADLVCSGRDRETGQAMFVVVEVSSRVATRDVDRALTRAQLVTRLGEPAIPVVAGERIDREARQRAEQAGVRQIIGPSG